MKTILVSLIILTTVSTLQVLASSKGSTASSSAKLSTDIKFNGQMVGGKVQSPFESLTEVENEKQINDLIGVRKNFNDRIQKTKQMR